MKAEILLAIKQLTAEKALNEDVVFDAVERGMAAAVKRGYELPGEVSVRIDRYDGAMDVWSEMEVVEIEEDIADEDLQIDLERAKLIDEAAAIGSALRRQHDVNDEEVGGRIEAQTAKQVVLQALREAEREAIFAEYSGQGRRVGLRSRDANRRKSGDRGSGPHGSGPARQRAGAHGALPQRAADQGADDRSAAGEQGAANRDLAPTPRVRAAAVRDRGCRRSRAASSKFGRWRGKPGIAPRSPF